MKTILKAITFLYFSLSAKCQNSEKTAIYRWNFKKDWVEARADEGEALAGYGYKWNLPSMGDWVSVPESASAYMEKFGYTSKILLGYAYPTPIANSVAISRWYLERDKDWVTVPENASADMQRFGYINKTLIAYKPK